MTVIAPNQYLALMGASGVGLLSSWLSSSLTAGISTSRFSWENLFSRYTNQLNDTLRERLITAGQIITCKQSRKKKILNHTQTKPNVFITAKHLSALCWSFLCLLPASTGSARCLGLLLCRNSIASCSSSSEFGSSSERSCLDLLCQRLSVGLSLLEYCTLSGLLRPCGFGGNDGWYEASETKWSFPRGWSQIDTLLISIH